MASGRKLHLGYLAGFAAFLAEALPSLGMSVTLQAGTVPPAPVGSVIVWTANVSAATDGGIWYRFRVRSPDNYEFSTVRDFHPDASWEWVPTQVEGHYLIEVTARSRNTGEVATTIADFNVSPAVVEDTPVISPTRNELVFLYSAPPCPIGSKISVWFTASQGVQQSTPAMECRGTTSTNVYLAGLRPETDYKVHHVIIDEKGAVTQGPELALTTEALSFAPAQTRALLPSREQGVVLQNRVFERSLATDLAGNVIWYYSQQVPYLTRPEPGGYFFVLIENHSAGPESQLLREIDLAGNIVLETNAARLNEVLQALGKKPITGFHHEARRLPNGNIMVLAGTERMLTDVQEPGTVDVLGDAILVLDPNLQLVWAWDAFEHLDVSRKAPMDEKCVIGGSGCPRFYLDASANDWLHGNSLALTPDGNIIYSARNQDWIIKIHYAGGYGSGQVLWRLGKDGDFRLAAADSSQWFSHQHDANFIDMGASNSLLLFDNGNGRASEDDSAHSRGQLLELDEVTFTARLKLNADLGVYAPFLGTAEKLPNGNYYFGVGYSYVTNGHALMTESDASGKLVSQMEADTAVYRAVRMPDLYTPLESDWIGTLYESRWSRP